MIDQATPGLLESSSTPASKVSNTKREIRNRLFAKICSLSSGFALVILVILLTTILLKGASSLSFDFLRGVHIENRPEISGISQAIVGSMVLSLIAGLLAIPIGIGTAIYLEEFKPRNQWMRQFQNLVQLNINNLAGIPSIVYGILGVTAFVYMFGIFQPIQVNQVPAWELGADYFYQARTVSNRRQGIEGILFSFPSADPQQAMFEITEPIEVQSGDGQTFTLNVIENDDPLPTDEALLKRTIRRGAIASRFAEYSPTRFHLPLGKSVLSAGLTLALIVLPIVIIASQEAIRGVPDSLREASMGLGATRWQTVAGVVVPSALPGIMTGTILAMSRAIGEAAPIIAVMGGILGTTRGLTNLMDPTPILPVTIYKWSGHQNVQYESLAAAAIIVLLLILLLINSASIAIRYWFERKSTL